MAYSFRELKGRRTLITGEVRSGKTRLTTKLLKQATNELPSEKIFVLDFAPNAETPSGAIGLKLKVPASRNVKYLAPERVYAPRLEGKNSKEVLVLARRNKTAIDKLLRHAFGKIVFVNDVTLYLHCGSARKLIDLADRTETFIANGYKGSKLSADKGSGISTRESRQLELLASKMDLVITT